MADASSRQVRAPSATIATSGSSDVIDSWSLVSEINNFPGIQWSSHIGYDGSVIALLGPETIKKAEELQAVVLAGEWEELQASFDDDKGGRLELPGFQLAPSLTTAPGSSGLKFSGIHAAAKLSLYRPFVYAAGKIEMFLEKKMIDHASVAQRILDLLVLMTQAWTDRKDKTIAGFTEEEIQEAEAQNAEVLPLVEQMLRASIPFTELKELKGLSFMDNNHINTWLVSQLRQPGIDFFQSMAGIAQEFRFFYRPPTEKFPNGYFASYKQSWADTPIEKTIDVMPQFNSNPGIRQVLPLTKVVVTGLRPKLLLEDGDLKEAKVVETTTAMVGYPEKKPPGMGRTLSIPPPAFVPNDYIPPAVSDFSPPDAIDCEGYEKAKEEEAQATKQRNESFFRLCRRHAELVWSDVVLGKSQVTILTDLDFGWEVGSRYKVSVATEQGQTQLLTGFLSRANHDFTNTGASARAGSTLSFTHVEFGGFSLRSSVD